MEEGGVGYVDYELEVMWGFQEVAGGAAWGAFEGGDVEISDGDEEAGVGGVAEVTGKIPT